VTRIDDVTRSRSVTPVQRFAPEGSARPVRWPHGRARRFGRESKRDLDIGRSLENNQVDRYTAVKAGESAKAQAAEVSTEFEGLENVAPDSGGEEFGDDAGADGG
jgi:hypothetical protein